jgi:hypothetical protein
VRSLQHDKEGEANSASKNEKLQEQKDAAGSDEPETPEQGFEM